VRAEVAYEAIRLAHTLAALQPDEPEVHGLLALCELTAAHFPAWTGPDGSPVLLEDQDRRWDLSAIRRGLAARSTFLASGTMMSRASGTRPTQTGRSAARRPTVKTWAPFCSIRSATRRPNPRSRR
jgi:predicted RNA polymerase sigma factor